MKKVISYILITFCSFITYAQNVGIGTTTPRARLHVSDSSAVFSAVGIVPVNAGNTPLQGVGRRMMWYADKAAFRTGYASSDEWDKANIGQYSFATGYGVKASGDFSFSAGLNNIAGGQSSIAMGWNTQANTNFSIAIGTQVFATGEGASAVGYGNTAQGKYSLAMGYNSFAKSLGGTVSGQYNDIADNPNPNVISSLDRVFQVGNGYYDEINDEEVRKNAITVLRNGNVGLGTTSPQARLHVKDSSVLFTALINTTEFNPPVSGAGARMMWYAYKAAFRTGYIDDTQWDKDNIGKYSFSSGHNTIASGIASVSMGHQSAAIGNYSTSMGYSSAANGDYSTSMGYVSTASGGYSTSMGYQTQASGNFSTSMGYQTQASGNFSTSMGFITTASGYCSVSMGVYTRAKAYGSLTVGLYNDELDSPNPNQVGTTDRIFQIGNGTNEVAASRSNALTVLRNGNIGIGTTNPVKLLEVVGPASATPVTLVIGNRNAFGPAAIEFVSDYGVPNQWRPGYIRSNDLGGFTGSLEFYTNGAGSANAYGSVKGFEVRNGTALTANGTVGSYSDARLKNNITAFTDGLNVITKIKPVQFYYNADAPFKTDRQQVGIIAQELEKVAPYMIEKNKQNGYDDLRTVNNQAYTFLLINAVKEQQQQIERQQLQLESQQDKINRQEMNMERQQAQINELKKLVEQLLKNKS